MSSELKAPAKQTFPSSPLCPFCCWRMGWSFCLFLIFWPHHAACGILVPWPGIEPAPPAVEAWSLNYWTAREVPGWAGLMWNFVPTEPMCSWWRDCSELISTGDSLSWFPGVITIYHFVFLILFFLGVEELNVWVWLNPWKKSFSCSGIWKVIWN